MNLIAQTIAEMLDQSRNFTRFYLSQIDPERIHERHTFDGIPGNSAHFLMGHLAWSEWLLITEYLKQPDFASPLASIFHIKAKEENIKVQYTYQDLYTEMTRIHQATLEYIRNLEASDLEEEVYLAPANWHTTLKKALYHIIRHESFHSGQLALIAKVQGGKIP